MAKNWLPSLIDKALGGEEVIITRAASLLSRSGLPRSGRRGPPELTSGFALEHAADRVSD